MTDSTDRLPVALDAMGGDLAPAAAIEGALDALRRFTIPTLLVGDQAAIQAELARLGTPNGLPIVHATETIGMDEHAATVVRRRRDSSMHVCCRLVKEGRAAAAVSAGNSGAFFGVAMFTLGRVPGVDRPALATIFPTSGAPVLLLDVGANTEVKPQHLVQFALMGSIYVERVLRRGRPSVALLSNGEEEEKGPLVVQEAHQRLAHLGLNFIGNIEGKDVPRGKADVVVCDGFAGNVLIKTAEGVAETMLGLLRTELSSSLRTKLLAAGLRPAFRRVRAKLDYAEYGGAPLLGIQGVAIVAHGRSNANAIANAIRVAREAVDNGVVEALRDGVAGFG
ncbi:MAG TPA: phosphate acyltransferase PlsX [Chloroflexota bacterium]|nr:phosphate acyltransferase PlsX [Chloroflexota bacterium]